MANLNIGGFVRNLPVFEHLKVQDPWWLLLAAVPVILLLLSIRWRKRLYPTRRLRNHLVHDDSIVSRRRWPRHLNIACMLIVMLLLVYPAAKPTTDQEQQVALLIWVHDASESMSEDDALQDDQKVARYEASVAALEDSLDAIPPEYHRLLISFSGPTEIQVNLPTLDSEELLAQAKKIPRGINTAPDFGLDRALQVCRQFFNSQDDAPCEIFLLSDGECNPRPGCPTRMQQLAAEAAGMGATVHTVAWGNPQSEYRAYPEDMQNLAAIGGGRYLPGASVHEMAELYKDVAQGLRIPSGGLPALDLLAWMARASIALLALGFILRYSEQRKRSKRASDRT